MDYNKAMEKLEKFGQTHVLKYFEELNELEKTELLNQIDETDFSVLALSQNIHSEEKESEFKPLKAMQLEEIDKMRDFFYEKGIDAIKEGKIGAVLLAGGMGTRLGADGPKGVYNIGITKDVFIFERLIENLMDVVRMADKFVPLFIMTSDKNHEETFNFMKEHNYFGYDKDSIYFFKQEMSPASDYSGKVFMEEKYKMSSSPNGNGGWFSSMEKSGITKIIKDLGIEYLNVFAVDNVLQRIADPVFVGAVLDGNYAVGSKVVKKATRDEKVGVMCLKDNKPSIVEYYELTDEMMDARDEKGEPAYNYGVILNYLFRVKDLVEILKNTMPHHVVEKKIPYINEDGQKISPEEPNGYKYETLVLDMINLMENCLPFEVIRNKEFAPIKNKTGIDSVESARELLKENNVTL